MKITLQLLRAAQNEYYIMRTLYLIQSTATILSTVSNPTDILYWHFMQGIEFLLHPEAKCNKLTVCKSSNAKLRLLRSYLLNP